MRAIVCREYGPPELVLRSEDLEKPVPGPDEVLIKVRAAAVNPLDGHLTKGKPLGFRLVTGVTRPSTTRPGRDVAGDVQAVGGNVHDLKPGDEVFGVAAGAFAEYACGLAEKLARKPPTVRYEEAASAPIAGLTALQALRDKGHVRPGARVLVNGAAGGVGMFAVQIATSIGAHVTGVCSTRNVEMVRSLGAAAVVDYTREDYTRRDERYDLIVDSIRNHSLTANRRVLRPDGRLVLVGAPPGRFFVVLLAGFFAPLVIAPFVGHKVTFLMANINRTDLIALGDLMAGGRVTPVIDRREGLESVPRAVADVATRHARGKVVVVL